MSIQNSNNMGWCKVADNETRDIIEIKERLTKIEVLLSEKVTSLEGRVAKLENNQAWLVRTIVGAVIVALLAFVGL